MRAERIISIDLSRSLNCFVVEGIIIVRITWFRVTSSGEGIDGMLPCHSTHEAGSIPALTFRPGNSILFLLIRNSMTSEVNVISD